MSKVTFDLKKVVVKTSSAILDEGDFLSAEEIENGSIQPEADIELRDYIGLEITVRKDASLETQLKLAAIQQEQGATDPVKQVQLMKDVVDTLADLITDWSIVDGGAKVEVSVENLLSLPWWLFQAVNMTAGKALSVGRMSKN